MIEVRRDLYMDEKSREKNFKFYYIKNIIKKVLIKINVWFCIFLKDFCFNLFLKHFADTFKFYEFKSNLKFFLYVLKNKK